MASSPETGARPRRIACAGIAVIDNVYRVDRFPVPNTKTRAAEFTQILGGCAANAAVAVTRLGGDARLIAPIGGPKTHDLTGDSILARLTRENVDASCIVRVDGAISSVSSILIDRHGERLIVNTRHPKLDDARPADPDRAIAGVDALLIDNRFPDFVLPVAQAAQAQGMTVVLDADKAATTTDGLLRAATHIVFSADVLRAFAETDDLADALFMAATRTTALVGVTDGRDDMLWLESRKLHRLAAFRVDVVDTLAAGDVFHGAFALALAEGRHLREAMQFAAATAALKCTRFGGGSSCPTRAEVDDFIANHARK